MRFLAALALVGCSGGKSSDGGTTDTDGSGTDATPYEHLPIKANFQWDDATIDGKHVIYHVSTQTKPKALLFAFHGTNGSLYTVQQIEWLELYNVLVPMGYAVVLTQSLDRTQEVWNTDVHDTSNPDFRELVNVRQWLIDNTLVDDDTPIEGIGFSNGGTFVDIFASLAQQSGWDMRTFVVHNAPGYTSGIVGMWVSAENDEVVEPGRLEDAVAQCTAMTGVECPHVSGTEIPLDPRRFARMPQYSLEQSQAVFDDLVDLQYVDADGNRLVEDLTDVDAVMNNYIAKTSVRAPDPSLPPTELRVVWSTHRFSSQHLDEEVDWLTGHL